MIRKLSIFFYQKCQYDIILGSDFLINQVLALYIVLLTWNGSKYILPTREAHKLDINKSLLMDDAYQTQKEEEDTGKGWLDSYATT